MTISFQQLVQEVGEWSEENFGDQNGAGALAPFAGIVEELGENTVAATSDDVVDAYCDAIVFLADVCYRSGITIDPDWNDGLNMGDVPIFTSLGALAHVLLKRHQGIRGFGDEDRAKEAIRIAAANVFYALNWEFNDSIEELDLGEEVERTWEAVSKRDWASRPVTG